MIDKTKARILENREWEGIYIPFGSPHYPMRGFNTAVGVLHFGAFPEFFRVEMWDGISSKKRLSVDLPWDRAKEISEWLKWKEGENMNE